MCGGKLDSPAERVAHIAVNPDNIPGSSLNASSDFGLICLDFIEHVNPGLKFLRQVEVVKDTKHLGDLASIQEYFQNLGLANTMRPGRPTLVTDSPSALLKRISSPLPVETGNELESENSSSIHLPLMRRADSSDTKPLVEEYKPGGNPKPDDRKSDDFSRKLKDAFLREEEKAAAKKKEKKEVQGSIKLREEECFLKPVSTRVVRRNQLIWGRSVQNKDDESLAASTISIKVYLPGVHRIENILFSISEVRKT